MYKLNKIIFALVNFFILLNTLLSFWRFMSTLRKIWILPIINCKIVRLHQCVNQVMPRSWNWCDEDIILCDIYIQLDVHRRSQDSALLAVKERNRPVGELLKSWVHGCLIQACLTGGYPAFLPTTRFLMKHRLRIRKHYERVAMLLN